MKAFILDHFWPLIAMAAWLGALACLLGLILAPHAGWVTLALGGMALGLFADGQESNLETFNIEEEFE